MTIDSHHHFWRYSPDEYGWINDEMALLRRDFLPTDLSAEIAAAGVDGVVTVQARQTIEETGWLLDLAAANDFIKGVVGWAPLVEAGVGDLLDRFAGSPKLKAMRHVLHDEPDDDYMLRGDFNRGVAMLHSRALVYDILIFEKHLPQAIEFVDRHPKQVFVVDHIAKPRIRDAVLEPWGGNMKELARRENVYCKVSGMVTEAAWRDWTPDGLRPYFDAVLQGFGPHRLMFGTDWPVCKVACEYGRWAEVVRSFASELSADEQARLLGGTAVEAYNL